MSVVCVRRIGRLASGERTREGSSDQSVADCVSAVLREMTNAHTLPMQFVSVRALLEADHHPSPKGQVIRPTDQAPRPISRDIRSCSGAWGAVLYFPIIRGAEVSICSVLSFSFMC